MGEGGDPEIFERRAKKLVEWLGDNCHLSTVRSDNCQCRQLSVRTTVSGDNCQWGQLSVAQLSVETVSAFLALRQL